MLDIRTEKRLLEILRKYFAVLPRTISTETLESLDIDGDSALTGALNVTGNTNVTGNLTITGDTSTTGVLNVSGNTNITGAVYITGGTNVTGNFTVTGDANITGNNTFTGTLDVTGNTNITGSFTITGSTYVAGDSVLTGLLNVTGNTNITGSLTITGNVDVAGTITITGGDLNVSQVTYLGGTSGDYISVSSSGDFIKNGNAAIRNKYVLVKNADSPYSASSGDEVIGVTTTGGSVNVILKPALLNNKQTLLISDEGGSAGASAGANVITVIPSGGALINGGANYTISSNYGTVQTYNNGSNWFVF